MSVETFEQPAAARSAPAGTAPPPAAVSVKEVEELTDALRGLMMQAKQRHRTLEQTSDHGRVSVLFVLSKHGPMRASELAKEVTLDLSTVSRHLRALEDEGHIAKSADPDDKRAFQVGLTERGQDFVQEFWRNRVAVVHGALSSWAGEDVRTLTDLLGRFVRDTEGCFK
jgi:DNA-binding MarR family transcriptional regulator